ncbi:hypothetical protein Ancab_028820 [Ancistrocladus abbreviatus]
MPRRTFCLPDVRKLSWFEHGSYDQFYSVLCAVYSLKDFDDFANAIDYVKDYGVALAVACPEHLNSAKDCPCYFQARCNIISYLLHPTEDQTSSTVTYEPFVGFIESGSGTQL